MLQKYAAIALLALSILLFVAAEDGVGVRRDNNIHRLAKSEKKTIAILGKSAKSKSGKSLKDAKAKKVSKSSKFLKSNKEEIDVDNDNGVVTGCEGGTSQGRSSRSCLKTTVYFVRHGERDKTRVSLGPATTEYNLKWDGDVALITPDNDEEDDVSEVVDDDYSSRAAEKPSNIGGKNEAHTGENLNEVCGQKKCALELSRQGLTRARLLADWMKANGIVKKLTNVYSSHKRRTYQTVAPTAKLAGLKVQQLPKGAEELDPESNAPSVCPTIKSIRDLPLGSTALVAAHTSTIYRIMDTGMKRECKGLGLDTSNPTYFPKTRSKDLPRPEYSNVWEVSFDKDGVASLVRRYILDFAFEETIIEA